MNRDELRKRAAELEIPGRGKMLKPELIAAIEAAEAQRAEPDAPSRVVPNRADLRRKGMRGHQKAKPPTRRKVMPLHYRGRATGAKHLPPKVRTESVSDVPGWPAGAPLGYDSREDRYMKQRNGSASLTARQERRLRHKANHHNAVMADPR